MPDLLSDPPTWMYVILSSPALVCFWAFVRYQTQKSLLRFILAAIAPTALLVCDRLFESPREEAVRRVELIVEALNQRDKDKVLEHISADFDYHTYKKPLLRNLATWDLITSHNVQFSAWDFDRDDIVDDKLPGEIAIGFSAIGKSPDATIPPVYIRATFTKDPDGRYRVKTFVVKDPMQKMNGEDKNVPGW